MRLISLFGIVALLPAALNASPAMARASLAVPLCTGDGVSRTVRVPVGSPRDIPGADQSGCCAKGCHSGSSRKRGSCCDDVDPAQ